MKRATVFLLIVLMSLTACKIKGDPLIQEMPLKRISSRDGRHPKLTYIETAARKAALREFGEHWQKRGNSWYTVGVSLIEGRFTMETQNLSSSISEADKLNGITGSAIVTISASAVRRRSEDGTTWSEWRNGVSLSEESFLYRWHVIERNGKVEATTIGFFGERSPFNGFHKPNLQEKKRDQELIKKNAITGGCPGRIRKLNQNGDWVCPGRDPSNVIEYK